MTENVLKYKKQSGTHKNNLNKDSYGTMTITLIMDYEFQWKNFTNNDLIFVRLSKPCNENIIRLIDLRE